MEIKREKDGSIKGIFTMGDVKEKETERKKQREVKERLEKKYGFDKDKI